MKRALPLLVVTLVALVAASAALGVPPTHSTQTAQFTLTNPTACGDYGVRWSINLVADVTTFFDNEGRRASSSRTSARTTQCRTPSPGSCSGTGL